MADEIQDKSQVKGEAGVKEAGTETPQSFEQVPVAEQPGAEAVSQTAPAEPAVAGKVFTEAEVAERESAITSKLQTETAAVQERLGRLELERQVQELVETERKAQERDTQDVSDGVITEADAGQRRNQRIQTLQGQAQVAQLQRVLQGQMAQGEQLGRITMAHDLGTKYGVNPDVLLKDTSIKTPMQMIQKATDLALADRDTKLRALSSKAESFDKGQQAETTGTETTYEESLKARYPSMYRK